MRHILTSVVLIVLLFPTFALGTRMTDLMTKGGLYYKNYYKIFIGSPFTGKVTGKELGSFRNGKKDGLWVFYDKNGQKILTGNKFHEGSGTYKDGKKISD